MRQKLFRGLLAIYLMFLYLLHEQSFTRFPAVAKQKGQFLSFPENLANSKSKFYDAAHFPGVIRAIGCDHIRIICPNKENAMAFVKRKQFYSVQAFCDSDVFITNTVARWPGSTHDSRIF